MKHYYYSIYRKDYLYKGIVLYESMKKHDADFKFFLICMEEESVELLKKLKLIDLIPISIKEIEEYDKRIPELKEQRGEKTYIWTAKASVPLYLFDHYEDMDHVIWLDGDTEFMSNSESIYEQWGDSSVLLTEEKFDGEYEYLGHMVGFYNTGFMGFKNDEIGRAVLNYFKERLQEWKNSEEEQGSWNDQLYVDDWTERFPNIGVVKHNGINLTPFIASRINIEQNGFVNFRGDKPYIKDTPIVLYHFMALKYYDGNEFDLCSYFMKLDNQTIKKLYIPYFDKCSEAYARIRAIEPDFYPSMSIKGKYIGNYFNLKTNSTKTEFNICTITGSCQLPQTLSLYDSIKKYNINFRMWVCCEDESSYNTLKQLALDEIQLFEPSNLVENYNSLTQAGYQANREILKARLVNLIISNNYSVESILYVDCNCCLHKHPSSILDMLKRKSIFIVQDRALRNEADITGSVIGFHKDEIAMTCIFYWIEETKKWLENGFCVEDELNHINSWSKKYNNVFLVKNPAFLLDDKNLEHVRIKKLKDQIFVNNEQLILYKYKLANVDENTINSIAEQINESSAASKKQLYLPYIKSIRRNINVLQKLNHSHTSL